MYEFELSLCCCCPSPVAAAAEEEEDDEDDELESLTCEIIAFTSLSFPHEI